MDLARELQSILPASRVSTRTLDRIAFANDASVYRLVPRAVVFPESVAEIRGLLRLGRRLGVPLTFRSAGTSLSGQAVTDGILVVVSRYFRKLHVEDEGRRVRVEPGVIGGVVNQHLRPYGTKLGPDPASIHACMMGGILANNSSGMCCGVVHNAYHTLESMRFVLPDGLELDTARPGSAATLAREAPDLARGLLALKHRIESHPALARRIRNKYRMKNTMGYSLNAFLDFDEPLEILSHLMIGSEGTLGFIAEAVLRTVPDHPHRYTGLLFFPDVPRACSAIGPLSASDARALELMDRASLRSVEEQPGMPSLIRELPDRAAGILVEYQCATQSELQDRQRASAALLPALPLCAPPSFTLDPQEQEALWRVRKGLIPSVGALRRPRTSFIIEDVVFPVERLADGVTDLQALLTEHGYDDAIVFGHARDGNLHFVLTQAFDEPGSVARYDRFMHALAALVAGRYDGALKAEHGTGRNMAPFVAAEWGPEAHAIMRAVKQLIDPDRVLNPGVILNDDPGAHIRHLKDLPTVEPEIDACIECGFCERVCPSRDLTTTPRQRIVLRREMARLRLHAPQSPQLAELEADYRYAAIETCATDGLCALACPVAIDTGRLVKRLRRETLSATRQELAVNLIRHGALTEHVARAALRLRRLGGSLPGSELPGPAPSYPAGTRPEDASAVYFPSCLSRILAVAGDAGDRSLVEVVATVAGRAGFGLFVPEQARGHCCGLAFASKGYSRAASEALNGTVEALWSWSDGGRLDIVVDSSPCAHALKQGRPELAARNQLRFDRLQIRDSIELAHDTLLPRLNWEPVDGTVVLHPVCSVLRMNLQGKLQRVASACATDAAIPLAAGCCGFAGDRGFLFPELTAAATRAVAAEVLARPYCGYYSSSRTCEIGLSRATGKPYRSFWELMEATARAKEPGA